MWLDGFALEEQVVRWNNWAPSKNKVGGQTEAKSASTFTTKAISKWAATDFTLTHRTRTNTYSSFQLQTSERVIFFFSTIGSVRSVCTEAAILTEKAYAYKGSCLFLHAEEGGGGTLSSLFQASIAIVKCLQGLRILGYGSKG